MNTVSIQVQTAGGMWQTITSVGSTDFIGMKMRLDEANRSYGRSCRAVDSKSGCVVDFRSGTK